MEALILILDRKLIILPSKNIIAKLGRNDEMTIMICSKDDKLCFTIKYVSKTINYVPCQIPFGSDMVSLH
jgi:hypothetical protein